MALFFAKKESFSVASEQFARYEKLLKESEIDYTAEENESEIIITYPEKQHEKVEKIRDKIRQEDYENKTMSNVIDSRIFRTYGLGIFELMREGIISVKLNEEKTGGWIICKRKNEKYLMDLQMKEAEKSSGEKLNSIDSKIGMAGRSTEKNKIPTVKIKVERYLKNEIDRLLQLNFNEFYQWILDDDGYKIEIRERNLIKFYEQYMIALAIFEADQERLRDVLQPDKSKVINPEQAAHPEEREPKKKKLTRNKSMLVRLNQTEYDYVQTKIDKSGQRQSDYLRAQIMYGSVNQVPESMESIETLNELKNLVKEIGRIEGMIAKTIKVHEKSYFLSKEEMQELKKEVADLKQFKREVKGKIREWYG